MSTLDKRNNKLIFKVHLLEMDQRVLLDFRLSKVGVPSPYVTILVIFLTNMKLVYLPQQKVKSLTFLSCTFVASSRIFLLDNKVFASVFLGGWFRV